MNEQKTLCADLSSSRVKFLQFQRPTKCVISNVLEKETFRCKARQNVRTTAPLKPLGDSAREVAAEFLQFFGVNRKQRSDCRTLPIFSIQASLVLPSSCTHRKAPWQIGTSNSGITMGKFEWSEGFKSKHSLELWGCKDEFRFSGPGLPVWSWKLCKMLHISSWVQKHTYTIQVLYALQTLMACHDHPQWRLWVVRTPKKFPCQICCHPTQAAWFPLIGGT